MSITRLASGVDFNLLDPDPALITIRDIAQNLSRMCRYNGACEKFYSVAQHSVLVARIAAKMGAAHDLQFHALLHDAHEAYIGDITRPVLAAMRAESQRDIERIREKVDHAIFTRFGLPAAGRTPRLVDSSDNIALATEWRELMPGPAPTAWAPVPWSVTPLPPDRAENLFIDTFNKLEALNGPHRPAPQFI